MIRFRWRTNLKQAASEQDVIQLVLQYLDEWQSDERAALPPFAWPTGITTAKDVTDWTFRLGELHAQFEGTGAGLQRLQELWLFFTHAAVRITQLRGHAHEKRRVES